MPDSFEQARDRLAEDVRRAPLAPAADVRSRGDRRRLRQRAAVAGSAMLVAGAVAAVAVLLPPGTETPPIGSAPAAGPGTTGAGPDTTGAGPGTTGSGTRGCAVPLDLSLPSRPSDVEVRVVDGSGRKVADNLVLDLSDREFRARAEPDPTETLPNQVVGQIRYGPGAVGEAALIQAYLIGQAELVFQQGRGNDAVELVVGPAFQQLGTPTEVNQALAQTDLDAMPHDC
jgi:hypothetical protein